MFQPNWLNLCTEDTTTPSMTLEHIEIQTGFYKFFKTFFSNLVVEGHRPRFKIAFYWWNCIFLKQWFISNTSWTRNESEKCKFKGKYSLKTSLFNHFSCNYFIERLGQTVAIFYFILKQKKQLIVKRRGVELSFALSANTKQVMIQKAEFFKY